MFIDFTDFTDKDLYDLYLLINEFIDHYNYPKDSLISYMHRNYKTTVSVNGVIIDYDILDFMVKNMDIINNHYAGSQVLDQLIKHNSVVTYVGEDTRIQIFNSSCENYDFTKNKTFQYNIKLLLALAHNYDTDSLLHCDYLCKDMFRLLYKTI